VVDINSKNEISADEFLDCTGLYCPVPIFETRKKMDSIKQGQILKLTADDPASEEDIKSWAKTTGNELLYIEKDKDKFIFFIRKTKD
jgi:tRNA 2-thiouridine synthesizing protein A